MARTRTTKKLAQRIDLNYFKRPTPLKRGKFWLSLLLPLLALVWIGERSVSKDSRVYSSGRMSAAHAVLEKQCATCHVQHAGNFSAKAADAACLACHDGPVHHATQTKSPECSSCHSEHRGRVNIVAASNQSCAECHADLKATGGGAQFAAHIHSFENGHPQFAVLRQGTRDPGTIKLNHAIHMKPIRRGPNGPIVNLECRNCHQGTAADADLTYADARYRGAAVSYKDSDEVLTLQPGTLWPPRPISGRELMAPVKFANSCAACHLLSFDKRFDEGVPHDKPRVIHSFLVKKFQEYIAAHPAEVRVQRDPKRELTGKPMLPEIRMLTSAQWVEERTAEAEELLWRKTCQQCHTLTPFGKESQRMIDQAVTPEIESGKLSGIPAELPAIAPANVTMKWMPHTRFDHSAHTGFSCASCHAKVLSSTETGDILLPGIATCQTCHAPGPDHAESRCFECHTYHDWSKRKEVRPNFTLPALRSGNGEK